MNKYKSSEHSPVKFLLKNFILLSKLFYWSEIENPKKNLVCFLNRILKINNVYNLSK